MSWQLTADLDAYATTVGPLLAADPARQTIALTLLALRQGAGTGVFAWYTDPDTGQVTGAAIWTPRFELLLCVVPDGTVAPLAAALRERGVEFPGVNGDAATAAAFAAAWTAGTALRAVPGMRTRLYALDQLRRPPVPGRARTATSDDLPLVLAWCTEFEAEAHGRFAPDMIRRLVDDGLFQLWLDGDEPVALAGRKPVVAGVARVGPVYTVRAHRRRGYGGAVTAAATADALDAGAARVVLFTDVANPTSNSIYQQIGYRPLTDRDIIAFVL